jgi:hypothetical protein
MLAVLWPQRAALAGVFWIDQPSEPANQQRSYRVAAALVALLAVTLMGLGIWLSHSSRMAK